LHIFIFAYIFYFLFPISYLVEYNNLGRIGGDSGLSFHGVQYAEKLAEFVETKMSYDEGGFNSSSSCCSPYPSIPTSNPYQSSNPYPQKPQNAKSQNGLSKKNNIFTYTLHSISSIEGLEIPTRLWTSSMRRTKETTQFIAQKVGI
jgi:hypothetical protein